MSYYIKFIEWWQVLLVYALPRLRSLRFLAFYIFAYLIFSPLFRCLSSRLGIPAGVHILLVLAFLLHCLLACTVAFRYLVFGLFLFLLYLVLFYCLVLLDLCCRPPRNAISFSGCLSDNNEVVV